MRLDRQVGRLVTAALAGLLLALSAAPRSWWWFAPLGFAALFGAVDTPSWRRRFVLGWVAGAVLFTVTLAWTRQFHPAGWLLLSCVQALFLAVATTVTTTTVPSVGQKRGNGMLPARGACFVAALTLSESARFAWPFGGLPLGGITTGQADGPLLPAAAVMGEIGLLALAAAIGVALVALRRHPRPAAATVVTVVVITLAGHSVSAPATGALDVATVQAGGPRGLLRDRQRPTEVYTEHLALSETVQPPVDLVVWPENVVNVDRPVAEARQGQTLAGLARRLDTYLAAGVVESEGDTRFRNAVVAWSPDGAEPDRYEKVQRVPFGEYVPGRQLVERFADLSQVPKDAVPGRNDAVVRVAPGVDAAVAISYEGLFSRRVRAGVRDGGQLVVIPTNAASYRSASVPETQVAAARIRAVESRRWVVQAAPTGISAIVDDRGSVLARSSIGEPAVLRRRVELSSAQTPFTRFGDLLLLSVALVTLLAGSAFRRRQPTTGELLRSERTPGASTDKVRRGATSLVTNTEVNR